MADAPMHEPGSFCWADLATSEVQGVLDFYTGLFGWTSESRKMDGGPDYHLLKSEGGVRRAGPLRRVPTPLAGRGG